MKNVSELFPPLLPCINHFEHFPLSTFQEFHPEYCCKPSLWQNITGSHNKRRMTIQVCRCSRALDTTLKESTSINVAPSIWELSGWGRGKLFQSHFQRGGGGGGGQKLFGQCPKRRYIFETEMPSRILVFPCMYKYF